MTAQLSNGELAWLLLFLEERAQKLPGTRSRYQPFYDATSWDLDDLFRSFREDTRSSRDAISSAVNEYATTGLWPTLSPTSAFWLRARWSMARRYCQAALTQTNNSAPIPASRPTDLLAATRSLLLEMWDERLADVWLCENARSCVLVSWPEDGEDTEAQLELYLNRLEMSEGAILL